MPCRKEGKIEYILRSVKKNRTKTKEKKIRKKTEENRKKTKEKGELVQWACTNRSVSLSPPSNLTFFQDVNKDTFF